MRNRHKKILFLTQGALIAALYTALTLLSAVFGLSGGAVQLRLGEALTVLPVFTPAAVPGLFLGCLLANSLTGCALWDVVAGSLATLLGAVGTCLLRRHGRAALLPPIFANTVIVPIILIAVYHAEQALPLLLLTVGLGELLSCGALGSLLGAALRRCGDTIRWTPK